MGSRIVTKSALARHAGVSRNAVGKLCKDTLLDAVTEQGKVNAAHPLVIEWLATKDVHTLPPLPPEKKRRTPAAPKPRAKAKAAPKPRAKAKAPTKPTARPKTKVANPAPQADEPPAQKLPTTIGGYDIEDLEGLTVRQVVMRYGSVDGFKRFVDSLKSIADYKFRELRIKQHRGDLIERDLVAGAVFPLIDVAFQRLVSDVPSAVTQQVVARVESGGEDVVADVEKIIRDANSRVLKNAKESVTKLEVFKK